MRTLPALTIEGLAATPWALDRAVLAEFMAYARGEAALSPRAQATPRSLPGLIPIHGVIEHRSSMFADLFGGTSVEQVRTALRAAVADPQVSAIVLDVDSPGGGVAGITELAAEIRAARSQKRIVAVANTTAASAAYWLAAQADQLLITPSGQVGSVGIYSIHVDMSRALTEQGLSATIISAGEHKVEGNEFEPLSDEARAELQKRADAFYGQFVTDLAKGRRVLTEKVRRDYGQGRTLLASDALAAGMVDGIGTLDDAIRFAARSQSPNRAEADHSDTDLPFRSRVEVARDELASLVEHATVRASLRAKEGRRAFSPTTEAALRSIRDGLSALLTTDDPPAEPSPVLTVQPLARIPVQPAYAAISREAFRANLSSRR